MSARPMPITPSPDDWFAKFEEDSSRDFCSEPQSELGKCRRRYFERNIVSDPERGTEWDDHNSEWTAVMGLFLAQMAEDTGMVQEWQWSSDEFDFAWFKPGDSVPSILIEHENDSAGVDSSPNGEAWKLARWIPKLPEGGLGVLITYPWATPKESAPSITLRVSSILRRFDTLENRFLLVLGGSDWDFQTWNGGIWDGKRIEPLPR